MVAEPNSCKLGDMLLPSVNQALEYIFMSVNGVQRRELSNLLFRVLARARWGHGPLWDAVFRNDFTPKNDTPTLSLVTFVVTSFGNISIACLVVRSIRGALLGDEFVDGFHCQNRYPPLSFRL